MKKCQWSNYLHKSKSMLTKDEKDKIFWFGSLIWNFFKKGLVECKSLLVCIGDRCVYVCVCVCVWKKKSERIRDWDSLPCNKRWQGDKLVLSTEIDYFVFPSSSCGSHTDALKHLNDTLEKTSQVGSMQRSFPSSPHRLREWTAVYAAYIRGTAMQTSLDSLLPGDIFILYIRNPFDNPRILNAKMTNVSDFVCSVLGYIYPQLSGEVARIVKRWATYRQSYPSLPSKAKQSYEAYCHNCRLNETA